MFKKLLKYDMTSVWRLWWIAATIIPIASVVGALLLRFIISTAMKNFSLDYVVEEESTDFIASLLIIVAVFAVFACIMAIALSFVLTMVLVYVRFYKNLFTDEGYLTFTLPVSRKQILLSKTVNAFIWYCLHGLLIVGAVLIFLLLAPPAEEGGFIINTVAFKWIGDIFGEIWGYIGAWTLPIAAGAVVFLLITTLQGIALLHLSITIGSVIAKKAKIVAAIGIYYAFNTASSMIWQLIFSCFTYGILPGITVIMPEPTGSEIGALISLCLAAVIAVSGVITVVLYNLTQHMLDRKLNLA